MKIEDCKVGMKVHYQQVPYEILGVGNKKVFVRRMSDADEYSIYPMTLVPALKPKVKMWKWYYRTSDGRITETVYFYESASGAERRIEDSYEILGKVEGSMIEVEE